MKTIGSALRPYVKTPKAPKELFRHMEQRTAGCTIHYGYRPIPAQKKLIVVERYTFPSLRDGTIQQMEKNH